MICFLQKKVARFYPSLSDITVHDNFSNERLWDQGNDIALVRLPRPVEFRAGIKPVCLPWKNSLVQGETFLAGKAIKETQSPVYQI